MKAQTESTFNRYLKEIGCFDKYHIELRRLKQKRNALKKHAWEHLNSKTFEKYLAAEKEYHIELSMIDDLIRVYPNYNLLKNIDSTNEVVDRMHHIVFRQSLNYHAAKRTYKLLQMPEDVRNAILKPFDSSYLKRYDLSNRRFRAIMHEIKESCFIPKFDD